MKTKRFLSITLSIIMLLSLIPNAFAFEDLEALIAQQKAEYQQQLETIQTEYAQMQKAAADEAEEAVQQAEKAVRQATCPHNYKTVQNRDVIPATCETEGSHTEVTLCLDCELELESKKVTDTALGHNYVAEVTTPATETEEGVRTYTCSECGDSYTETIPVDDSSSSENKQMRISLKASGEASGDGPIVGPTGGYSLTLNPNYPGATSGGEEINITETTLPQLSRDGYLFLGWSKSSAGEVVYLGGDTITLTENTTLYAIWTINQSLIGDIPASKGGYVYLGGILWRVIGVSGDRYLLISADVLDGTKTWNDAKNYCGTVYGGFTQLEKNAVESTTKTNDAAYAIYAASNLSGAKLFLLSASEAMKYFSSSVNADRQPGWWWLRSPHGNDDSQAGCVNGDGSLFYFNVRDGDRYGSRPAFVLNRSSVLFESAAAGGKSDANGSFSTYTVPTTTVDRKLTLLDSSRSGFSATSGSATVAPGGTLAVTYSGAKNGTGEYVSAMLCDASGNPLYYASLTSAGSGTWNITIPAELAEGSYTLKVFSEQQNGNTKTDYASTPVEFALTVSGSAPITYAVTVTAGENMSKTGGEASQTVNVGSAMSAVFYTADEGYYFPTDYSVESVNGVSVTRNSFTQITVSGTPTANAAITLAAATAKTKPDAPTAPTATDCTTADNNDGTITGVTAEMEYKKADAESWTAGTDSIITGLTPGTYYVRFKATDTTLASENQELTIAAYTAPAATYGITTVYCSAYLNNEKISAAEGGKEITVSVDPESFPEGKYFTGAYYSEDVTIPVDETGDGTFTMPAKAVQVTAVLADREDKTIDLTGTAAAALPEEMAGMLSETDYFLESGLDLNKDGTVDVTLDLDNNTAQRAAGADSLTENVTITILTYEGALPYRYKSVTLKVVKSPALYTVTVNNGTADKVSAAAGETVAITANDPEAGEAFVQWAHVDGVSFANASSTETTFIMPAKDVTVAAVYAPIVIGAIGDKTYTGSSIEPADEVMVSLDGVDLVLTAEDYKVTFENNVNAGDATVIVTFLAPRAGTKSATFTILPADISGAEVNVADQVYNGTAVEPKPTVTWNGNTLTEEEDYTLSYNANTGVGTATVTLTGKGNFTGTKPATFTIGKGEDPAVVTATANVLKGGKTVDLSKNVTGAVGNLSFSITQALEGCSVNQSTGVFTSGSVTGECIVQVTIWESTNYKARTETITVTVSEEPQYPIEVKPAEGGKIETEQATAAEGDTVTLTVKPDEGYKVDTITVKNGEETIAVTEGENGTYTYTAPGAPVTVSVTFVKQTFTVIFADWNGTELQKIENVEYGETPVCSGNTPTRAATEETTYTFCGWDKEIVPVKADVTYTARYEEEKNVYEISYAWSENNSTVTATRKCTNNPALTVTETVNTEKTEKKPTCEEKGETVYTAAFTNTFFSTQTKTTEEAALGHLWKVKETVWASDHSSVTVTFVCERDTEHTTSVTTSEIRMAADDEKATYSAIVEVDGKEYPVKNEIPLNPGGGDPSQLYYYLRQTTTWVKGSSSGATFEIKRLVNDELTYSLLNGVLVDGSPVTAYSKAPGSIIITLSPGFLNTLSVGWHQLTVKFVDNGEAKTNFYILAASGGTGGGGTYYSTSTGTTYTYVPPSNNPRTGDENNLMLWGMLAAVSLTGAVLIIRRRKA